jgi:hypothetical protein
MLPAALRGLTMTGQDLAKVIARFPEDQDLIHRLALIDETFLGMCDEYALAQSSLAWLESREDGPHNAEVADYRSVIAELETEIDQILQRARMMQ